MIRFYGGGLVALLLLGFWLWAVFDVISTDSERVRNLPKGLWLLLVIFLGDIGSVAWLLLGRPEGASFSPGGKTMRRSHAEPVWMQEDDRRRRYDEMDEELDRRIEERRLKEWEDDLRRREQQLGGGAAGPGEIEP